MNRIILTKTIVLTEFVFHLKNLSAVCTDDAHKNGRLFRGVAYIYIYDVCIGVYIYIHIYICAQHSNSNANMGLFWWL